jgi:hypothetical protein
MASLMALAVLTPAAVVAAPVPLTASEARPAGSESPDDSYDTGRSECIGLLPQPDCGRPPEKSGDRGGWAQFVLFGIIVVAIAGIFTYVLRTVVRSDRRRAAAIGDSAWVASPGDEAPPG